MGWTMHFYSNVTRNYGSKLAPADTVEDFPGLSTVYLRIPWAYLEPEEGRYNWAILDTPAQRWIAKGKRIALRLTCSENWMRYATPKWVVDAGAQGTFYKYGKGPVENGPSWDPFFDDPIFLEKLDRFLAAVAKRYDGNPNVEFIDVGTYGLWGEGHTYASSQQDVFALKKLHIDLHLKHFKQTLLCISDDFAGPANPGKHFPITDYALSQGVTIRDDSILVARPPNSWYHAEMAEAVKLTFKQRSTELAEPIDAFSEAFIASRQPLWTAFRKRLKQEHIPESFAEITSEVEGFMKPIIQGEPSGINWLPAGPWS